MILTDTCISRGMEVPELKEEDIQFVISGIDFPPHAPVPRNPIDFAGSHTALMDATVINRLAQLDDIDGIISYRPITFNLPSEGVSDGQVKHDAEIGKLVAAVPQQYKKPVVLLGISNLITTNDISVSETITKALDDAGIPSYSTPEEAALAMHTLVKYAGIKKRLSQ